MTACVPRFELLPASAVAGLREQWLRLEARADAGVPFGSHAFAAALLAVSAGESGRKILCGWEADDLVLAAVIGLRRSRLGGTVALVGQTGNDGVDGFYTEHTDLLVAEGHAGLREAALRFLADALGPVRLRAVRANDALSEALGATCEADALSSAGTRRTSWLCDLRGAAGVEDVVQRLGRNTRTRVRRAIRFHEAEGPLRVERAASPEERADALDALVRLHDAAWESRGVASTFTTPDVARLHRALIEDDRANADFHSVHRGGELIGVLYSLTGAGRAFCYQSGLARFDHSHALPGFVAHALVAGDYAARGFRAYVLMSGDHPYKERLATTSEPLLSLERDPVAWRRSAVRRVRSGKRATRRIAGAVPLDRAGSSR